MIKVGIVGGTGYSGVELLRILAWHPEVKVQSITSRKEAGTPVAEVFHSLRGAYDLAFSDPQQAGLEKCDCVFFATPNGVAMSQARRLLEAGVRIVDFSADFRIQDVALWEQWYKMSHAAPDLVKTAVYGLPEVFRSQIRTAALIANPGCYPTAVQLGFLPAVEAGLVDIGHLVADVKSGVSGAGRKEEMGLMYCEASDSLKAYNVAGHRHQPEIVQGLSRIAGKTAGLTFVPHLAPMIRGIHATLYARITKEADFQKVYAERFAAEPFVDVLPSGSHPDTRSVRASNVCRIAVHRPGGGDTLVVLAVEDNLVKGAAGQAVQNMNIMFGFPETLGLASLPVLP